MKQRTPERIYNWLNSQLSIARHYGGCRFNGAEYVIAYAEEGQPLVRTDLLKKPKRKKKAVVTHNAQGQPTCSRSEAEAERSAAPPCSARGD